MGDKPLPEKDAEYIKGWRELNPDFEIKVWNNETFPIEDWPFIKYALGQKNWALAADAIRVIVLEKYGGIYLDTDMELLKPLADLTQYEFFAGYESTAWCNTAVIGAAPHHPIIARLLQRYKKRAAAQTVEANLQTVHALSKTITDLYGIRPNGKTTELAGLKLFAPKYFYPIHYTTGKLEKDKDTIGIHHYASTWHNKKQKRQLALMRFWFRITPGWLAAFSEQVGHWYLARKI